MLLAAAAALGGGSAQAQQAPYGSPPPSPASQTSPPPISPAPAPPPPSPGTVAQPAPAAETKVDELVAALPTTVTTETRAAIEAAVDAAADGFASAGLTPAQQVVALDALSGVIASVSVGGLTPAQVQTAIDTAAAVVPGLLQLSESARDVILEGLTSGIKNATAGLADAATQQAVVSAIGQAVEVLSAAGKVDLLTADVVSRLVTVTAASVSTRTDAGDTGVVTVTPSARSDGSVQFEFKGLLPGSTGIVVLTVRDPAVAAALRIALGAQVLSATTHADGHVTLVLTGTANELGMLLVSAPASAFGTSTTAGAQKAIDGLIIGAAVTAASGETTVFAGPAALPQVTAPLLTARATPVVSFRGVAVLTGAAQPGTTLQLFGRTATGSYTLLRTQLVAEPGAYFFSVKPHASMRFFVRSTLDGQSSDSASTVVGVRAAVSQAVARTAPRTYVFSGRVAPATPGVSVLVFYKLPDGRTVFAGDTRTRADGSWTFTRRFVGSGTFPFFARSFPTTSALTGTSTVQQVTIR